MSLAQGRKERQLCKVSVRVTSLSSKESVKSHTGINSQLHSFKRGHLVHQFLSWAKALGLRTRGSPRATAGVERPRASTSLGLRSSQQSISEHAGTIPPPLTLIRQHHEGNNCGSCLRSISLVPGAGYILLSSPHLVKTAQGRRCHCPHFTGRKAEISKLSLC